MKCNACTTCCDIKKMKCNGELIETNDMCIATHNDAQSVCKSMTNSAYIVDEEAEIGNHYHKVAEFETWLKIYDDAGLVDTFEAPRIAVYRSAERGCIIHISQIGERSNL